MFFTFIRYISFFSYYSFASSVAGWLGPGILLSFSHSLCRSLDFPPIHSLWLPAPPIFLSCLAIDRPFSSLLDQITQLYRVQQMQNKRTHLCIIKHVLHNIKKNNKSLPNNLQQYVSSQSIIVKALKKNLMSSLLQFLKEAYVSWLMQILSFFSQYSKYIYPSHAAVSVSLLSTCF